MTTFFQNGINGKTKSEQATTTDQRKLKRDQAEKISAPFKALVKMSSGKNPSTFTLPPELTCHTYFPGNIYKCYFVHLVLVQSC